MLEIDIYLIGSLTKIIQSWKNQVLQGLVLLLECIKITVSLLCVEHLLSIREAILPFAFPCILLLQEKIPLLGANLFLYKETLLGSPLDCLFNMFYSYKKKITPLGANSFL